MKLRTYIAVLLVMLMASIVAAQDPTAPPQSPIPGPTGSTMPSWIFYWLLGLGSTIIGALIAAIKILWNKTQDGKPGLIEDERTWLRELHEWHAQKDNDGVFKWMVPRSLSTTIDAISKTAGEIVQGVEGVSDAKEEKRILRETFEAEKSEMRTLYTGEITTMRGQLTQEQQDRRQEMNDLLREVMTTAKEQNDALRELAHAVEQFRESME